MKTQLFLRALISRCRKQEVLLGLERYTRSEQLNLNERISEAFLKRRLRFFQASVINVFTKINQSALQ